MDEPKAEGHQASFMATITPVEATLPDSVESQDKPSRPEERQEFFMPVHGFVWFYPEEMAIIDHPAFQRLASMHQLGMAPLVFRGGTHRRIEHALGTVWVVQRIVEAARHNSAKRQAPKHEDKWLIGRGPSDEEIRFARLGALLHDIGHVPYGHTFEDELHLIGKHDGEQRLDRILAQATWYGKKTRSLSELVNDLYRKYVPVRLRGRYEACDVLKSIILHQDDEPADDTEDEEPWERSREDERIEKAREERQFRRDLADEGFRVRICRDIVGNTICADLLDYLHRDWYHIGKPKHFDERIFQYMEIRTRKTNENLAIGEPRPAKADDRFVISIGYPPNLRSDGISAILDLLESRYQLSEAVIFHRTKMTATAMLERLLALAATQHDDMDGPTTSPIWLDEPNVSLEDWLLSNPEDALLPGILEKAQRILNEKKTIGKGRLRTESLQRWEAIHGLASKLLRRDLYYLLRTTTYGQLLSPQRERIQDMFAKGAHAARNRREVLRLLECDYGLPIGSIAMYCPEPRMNSKIAEVQLFVDGDVDSFVSYEEEHDKRLSAGHLGAQVQRFLSLWRISFYIDPEEVEKRESVS